MDGPPQNGEGEKLYDRVYGHGVSMHRYNVPLYLEGYYASMRYNGEMHYTQGNALGPKGEEWSNVIAKDCRCVGGFRSSC